MKWMLLAILATTNFVLICNVFIPSITDWYLMIPDVSCAACDQPEVQRAIAHAVREGRAPFLAGMEAASYWLFGSLAINLAAAIWLLRKQQPFVDQ